MAENKEIPWEKELIEKYMFTLHKEQVKDRRWRTMLRVLRASGFVLLMIGFIILASNPGGMPWQSAKAGAPHTAYINIRGEIAAGTLMLITLSRPSKLHSTTRTHKLSCFA
ncbi:hypothetical protein [Enterobacter cloacae complex sp. 304I2]|uniref:hypothetical protein n=1 Tax=Enterobacter cloacae complex sp. 304I2 TaxID=3395829 RepID=UPI003CEA08C8